MYSRVHVLLDCGKVSQPWAQRNMCPPTGPTFDWGTTGRINSIRRSLRIPCIQACRGRKLADSHV